MHIKNIFNKKILLTFFILVIIESTYIYVFPSVLNHIAEKDKIHNFINKSTNAYIEYKNAKFKTSITPNLTLDLDKIIIQDKNKSYSLIDADNICIEISLTDLLRKRLNIRNLKIKNAVLYIFQNKEGIFNFEELFPQKAKNPFHLYIKNNNISVENYNATFEDKILNKKTTINGEPFKLNIINKNNLTLITKGYISTETEKSDFDINILSSFPLSSEIKTETILGKCTIYNINLDMLFPYIKKYINNNLTNLSGNIDYIQLSTSKENNLILNTSFENIIVENKDWTNSVNFSGKNTFNTNIKLLKNIIEVKSLNLKSDKVNIKADGTVNLEKEKPQLDVNVEIINSKAERITPLLPENLTKELRTIEKIKNYGVFGDVEGKINIKGTIPQPDITGYVKGRNIHVLEKSIHKLHTGSVDITFNKRILNMDILVNLIENQWAKVNGYVYMYRDGINNVTVKTSNNLDFPLAQKIIVPISKVFNFQLGPIPDMNIKSGKGIIDINIQGSLDLININGFSEFRQADLSYNGLYGEVKKGSGRLDFKEDIITFRSNEAYVKSNPINVEGKVKINDNLNFNISSNQAKADDILEIINKSSLLKDVKEGIQIITDANGLVRLFVNIRAKIVPVPFGQPPLPPDEAFEDMKVKGSLYLLGNSCYIEGFRTPIEKLKGIVDFTESIVNIQSIDGVSGTSPINIKGQIITDIDEKIPDVDLTVTSDNVNLKDTIRFLTESYLYPENYPDLSIFYNLTSKHNLLFKYKAKSKDFETEKAYALMEFIPDNEDTPIRAKSGKIIMDKACVKVDNVNVSLYDSNATVTGNVTNIDTINPIYNLKIKADNFNIQNLNDTSKINIITDEIQNIFKQFINYKGFADINISINKNIFNGKIYLKKLQLQHFKTKQPITFDNFYINFKDNKIILNNITANIGDMPLYGNLTISDYLNPHINGYFTSKPTNEFIRTYFDENIASKLKMEGDISFSAKIEGREGNLSLMPKLTLNEYADLIYDDINIGDINDKREFSGKINIIKNKIFLENFEYIKFVSSQNNKTYPIVFLNASGVFENNKKEILPLILKIKTNKNLPARMLNLLLKTPVLKHGTFNCDLKYEYNKINKTAKLLGKADCRNIDIPLFDTLIKNIRVTADKDIINLAIFGFMSDAKVNIKSSIKNNFKSKPQIESLNIYADQIDINKLFDNLSKTHNAMNTNNKIKNIDLAGLSISNGHLEIEELLVKSLAAKNFISDFYIDKNGIFTANNMTINIGEGNMIGTLSYNLNDTTLIGDFELNDVDSNYIAETLFDGENQIYGNANGKLYLKTKGLTDEEKIKNISGYIFFDISDGRMPKLGSLEYLLRASNILKSGITGFTINSILELLNLVKTGYFSNINGNCIIENGQAKDIEIFSKGENLSLYIHGTYDITQTHANFEILGKLSKRISTIFGTIGNTSLNTFFKLIPGISLFDFSRKDFIQDVEKIPSFTNGDYESRIFQAIIDGNINDSDYVQSFKWVQ